jgi:C4-type Zn-finger protein
MDGADAYISTIEGELSRLRDMVIGLQGRMAQSADMRTEAQRLEAESAETHRYVCRKIDDLEMG